ncbi:MAG: ATP-dependent helicase, partial [Cyanobium sp.]
MRCLLRLGPTGRIEVISPYDAVTQAQLRSVRPRGHWNGASRHWDFPLEAAPALLRQLAGRFPLDPELEEWLAWMGQPLPPLPPHRQLVRAAQL